MPGFKKISRLSKIMARKTHPARICPVNHGQIRAGCAFVRSRLFDEIFLSHAAYRACPVGRQVFESRSRGYSAVRVS